MHLLVVNQLACKQILLNLILICALQAIIGHRPVPGPVLLARITDPDDDVSRELVEVS
jgi:hypothetical protein